jgi:hypothetical protein
VAMAKACDLAGRAAGVEGGGASAFGPRCVPPPADRSSRFSRESGFFCWFGDVQVCRLHDRAAAASPRKKMIVVQGASFSCLVRNFLPF